MAVRVRVCTPRPGAEDPPSRRVLVHVPAQAELPAFWVDGPDEAAAVFEARARVAFLRQVLPEDVDVRVFRDASRR